MQPLAEVAPIVQQLLHNCLYSRTTSACRFQPQSRRSGLLDRRTVFPRAGFAWELHVERFPRLSFHLVFFFRTRGGSSGRLGASWA